jgi:hypothetical protein
MSSEKSTRIENISLFQKGETVAYLLSSRPTQRGVGHRHDEGRVAVDAEVPITNGAEAYGEDVWS